MRQNWPCNRVFKSFDDIVDQCSATPVTHLSINPGNHVFARRDRAVVGYGPQLGGAGIFLLG